MVRTLISQKHARRFKRLVISRLANFGTFVALASYSRQKADNSKEGGKQQGSDSKIKLAAMIQTLLSMSLTIYIWCDTFPISTAYHARSLNLCRFCRATAPTFGFRPGCSSSIRYMFFVISTPALKSGRIAGLFFSSLLTTVYLGITVHELRGFYRNIRGKKGPKSRSNGDFDLPSPVSTSRVASSGSASLFPSLKNRPLPPLPSSPLSLTSPASPTHPHSPRTPRTSGGQHPHPHGTEKKRRPKRRRWSSDLDPMLVGIVICEALVFTYFIVSSELLLQFNRDTNGFAGQWGFGQVCHLFAFRWKVKT